MKNILPILGIAALLMASCNTSTTVDLVIYGGTIHSLDSANTVHEALAIDDGKVVAIGTNDEIQARFTGTVTQNLEGKHVFPGLIDAHCHLYGLGEQETIVGLLGATSPSDVVTRLQAATPGQNDTEWLRGRGWDQNKWPEQEFPTRELLDAAFPTRPVFLVRVDGHAAWVNSKALEIAGITADTRDPQGGKILRNAGQPTGILIDNAIELVRAHIASPDIEQYKSAYRKAIQRCLSYGLTGAHDMGLNTGQITALRQLIAEDALPFRITGYIDGTGEAWDALQQSKTRRYGADQLTLAGLKLYADGALGSRGALLLEPYADDPGNRGVSITSEDAIADEAVHALNAGLQVCVHAIGDSAVRLTLNAFERALQQHGTTGLPLRIEHAQVIHPQDLLRFASLGVIPSMQPTHCTSDMYWAEARLGPVRVTHAYPWQSLLDAGCLLPFGSDFPVEHPDPLAGIYAAATRRDKQSIPASSEDIAERFARADGSPIVAAQYENGWYGTQWVSRLNALRGFTSSAAKAAGQEGLFGMLAPGMYADFVITTVDIETCGTDMLLASPIEATYVGGNEVYRRK